MRSSPHLLQSTDKKIKALPRPPPPHPSLHEKLLKDQEFVLVLLELHHFLNLSGNIVFAILHLEFAIPDAELKSHQHTSMSSISPNANPL